MRFRTQPSPPPPQVDLIPMLTVMMGVLAFFVVITTTLSQETLVDIQIPGADQATPTPLPTDPFIVELVGENEVLLNGQPTDLDTLTAQMEAYLSRNPNDTIFLLPNQNLPYEQVMQFLGEMRRIGGDRVSLAIEEQS